MRTQPLPAYDLATLRRARYRWGLHIANGLATTYHWVARAPEGIDLVTSADSHDVTYYRDPLPRPSYRAAKRALLADLQRHVDAHPAGGAPSPVVADVGAAGDTVWYVQPGTRLRLGIPPACAALVGAGDRLLAARAHRTLYLVVVRAGTAMAAIRAELPPGVALGQLPALPAVERRPVHAATRHRAGRG